MAYSPSRGRQAPYQFDDRAPVSPLLPSQYYSGTGGISALPSLQSLRTASRNQDAYELNHQFISPIMSRSPSVASDRYSTVSGLTSAYFPGNPQNVNPAPAYVAPFGAAQVVSEHQAASQRPSSDDEDSRPNKNDVVFSEVGLATINAFLDQLLFSFLSTARSTNLVALRLAVTEILKHRLARDAIASAEEELRELLAGGEEEEEMNTKQNSAENNRRWDLELVWKRTRLRVMVYMRLGELEDEDEERYVKEEELFQGNERRFSQTSGLVSWATAIFLTGVLEYVAEQTLQVAGQAAYNRARRQSRSARVTSAAEQQKPVTVEEYDVEKVALNSTLGRLWRTWRKSLRTLNAAPATPTHRASFGRLSNENFHSAMSTGRGGYAGAEGSINGDALRHPMRLDDVPEMQFPEHVLASNIPLPMGERRRDIDEIEVPGLARDPDEAVVQDEDGDRTPTARRNSFTGPLAYETTGGLPTPTSASPVDNVGAPQKPVLNRMRSMSVPTPARTPLAAEQLKATPGAFPQDGEEEIPDEQKANAAEMAAHKAEPHDVKSLLDKVVQHAPPDDSEEAKEKSDHHGLLGAAIAGATAATAAAAALVYGSKDNTNAPDAAQSSKSEKEIEELDKRKSLMDIKDLIAPEHSEAEILTSRKVSVSQPETPPTLVRNGSDDSQKSYTLGHKDGQDLPRQSPAKRQHMPQEESGETEEEKGNGIGVARTSDIMVASPVPHTPSPDADHQQARSSPADRTSRFMDKVPSNGVTDSPVPKKNGSPKTPQEFLESRSLTSKTERPDFDQVKQTQTPQARTQPVTKAPQKRRSIPGVAFTSAASTPVVERNPHRQSWSAAVQQQREQQEGNTRPSSVPAVPAIVPAHPSTAPDVPVQEHPVVQRMASLKRNQRKSDPDAGDDAALTSASIRGPEDFDMFVQAGDTVKYTLTPETVREGGRPVQMHNRLPSASNPAELSSAPSVSRRSAPASRSGEDNDNARTGRSQTARSATSASAVPESATRSAEAKRESRRSISRPPPRNVSAHRKSGLMAREPQVMTESTRDFADFIRSTGPSKDLPPTPIINPANRSTTSLHSLRSTSGGASRSASVVSQDRTRSLTKSVIDGENVPPVPPMPNKAKSSMQPRAGSSAGGSNAELIDFIRSGPHQEGQHRIPRNVAPFRSTMDSDQLQDIGDRINGKAPLDLSLSANGNAPGRQNLTTPAQKSRSQAPTNASRSAGLNSNANATVHPAHSGQPQRLSTEPTSRGGSRGTSFEAAPVRKRHRNKDPYAIDMDDEDDDLLTALPKNKRQEESLMDFLNNTEPPKDNAPRPLANGNAQTRSMVEKSRTNSLNRPTSAHREAAQRTKSLQNPGGPRPGYASSVQSNTSAQRARPTSSAAGPPGPKPKMEARSPGESIKDKEAGRSGGFRQGTGDLAKFLKDSGPEDPDSAPAPIVGRQVKISPKEAEKARKKTEKDSKKSGSKSSGFFGKIASKKRTWLDMP